MKTEYDLASGFGPAFSRPQTLRWAKYGATNVWQYYWRRLSAGSALLNFAKSLAARLRQHKFGQIVPLGKNCEVAFRFYRRWGFVDSSLFAWALTSNLTRLSNTIENIDTLPNGAFSFCKKSNMWKHEATGTCFHGKLGAEAWVRSPTAAELDADLADLRSRLGHLVEKFRRYATNEQETLFVHRLSDSDVASPELSARLDGLEKSLDRLGAKNYRLLVVCRRCDLRKMPLSSARRLYRSVTAFNPGSMVTNAKIGDPVGWNAIFTEFAPAQILPKRHAFKFE